MERGNSASPDLGFSVEAHVILQPDPIPPEAHLILGKNTQLC